MRIRHAAITLAIGAALAACGEGEQANKPPGRDAPLVDQPTSSEPRPAARMTEAPELRANAPEATGAVGAQPTDAQAFKSAIGKSFSGGSVTLRLAPDQRFSMRSERGQEVAGRYAESGGVLIFEQPEGEAAGGRFPMRCRFVPLPNSAFRLADVDGSCRAFADVTFAPIG